MAFLQLGDIADSSFSTRIAGVVNPADAATLATFKNMQAQMNRVAQKLGFAKITVDGSLGQKTATLLFQISAYVEQGSGLSEHDPALNILKIAGGYSLADIARHADTIGPAAQALADQLGVPPKVSQPSGPSTIALPSGGTQKITTPTPAAASLVDSLGQMDSTTLLLAAAAAGAVIYFGGGKPKRTSSRRSRSTRRSRRFARRGSRR